jgi:hypothetical protein
MDYNEILENAIQLSKDLNLNLEKCISLIKEDINNQKTTNIEEIQESIQKFALFYINEPCSLEVDKFTMLFSEICYNWSKCFSQNTETLCLYINRLSELKIRSINALGSITRLYNKFNLLINWTPPIFNITQKYVDSIFDELEQDKKNQ